MAAAQLREVVGPADRGRALAATATRPSWSRWTRAITRRGWRYLLRACRWSWCVRVRADRVFYGPPARRGRPAAPGGRPRHGTPVRCADPATWARRRRHGAGAQPPHGPAGGGGLAAGPPAADPQNPGLGGPPRATLPAHRGHPHPARRRPAAGLPGAGADVAVGLGPGRRRGRGRPRCGRPTCAASTWSTRSGSSSPGSGGTSPLLRDPAAADRWTWLIIACCAQLWLARPLAADIRLPWQRPQPAAEMTPGRVRAGFRHIRAAARHPRQHRRNPPCPAPAARKDRRTRTKHPASPSASATRVSPQTSKRKQERKNRLNEKLYEALPSKIF